MGLYYKPIFDGVIMGFRFRRSISICPGVRLNLGKSGLTGLSIGPRGASLSVGSRGTHANIGLPGTGLSYRTRLDNTSKDENVTKRSSSVNQKLMDQLDTIKNEMDFILNIHTSTPNVHESIALSILKSEYLSIYNKPFSLTEPVRPDKLSPPPRPTISSNWLVDFFSSNRSKQLKEEKLLNLINRWEVQNLKDQANYVKRRSEWAREYASWKRKKEKYNISNIHTESFLLNKFSSDNDFFEERLKSELYKTVWPRETIISFEIDSAKNKIRLAVDLPEIEDIPDINFKINKRGTEILKKTKSDKQLRLEYARLVHGTLLRLTGIAFYNIPFESVEICGFTQRLNKATGYIEDDYIIEVIIKRSQFEKLNFSQLNALNPIEALETFQLNRKMTSTGIFKSLKNI